MEEEWADALPFLATPEEDRLTATQDRDRRAANRRREMDADRTAARTRAEAVAPIPTHPPVPQPTPGGVSRSSEESTLGMAHAPSNIPIDIQGISQPSDVTSLLRELLHRTSIVETRMDAERATRESLGISERNPPRDKPPSEGVEQPHSDTRPDMDSLHNSHNATRGPTHPFDALNRPGSYPNAPPRATQSTFTTDRRSDPGNLVAGLPPLTTMVTPFARVVDYRTYRLLNREGTLSPRETMDVYYIKQRIDGLHPTLESFTGSPAINLLSFLATMRDALNTAGASEAMGMRVIAYYLGEEARDVHEEQISSATDDPEEELFGQSTVCTWPHVVDALLRRFLTDEVLQTAYNAVTRCCQGDDEDEAAFATRISKNSRRCRHVFRKADVVNYFVCGLHPAVRDLVVQHIRMMAVADRSNLATVKLAAVAIGKSQRWQHQSTQQALLGSHGPEGKPRAADRGRTLARPTRTGKVMTTPRPVMIPPAQSPPWETKDDSWTQESDQEAAAVIAADLGTILYTGEQVTSSPGGEDQGREEIRLKVLRDLVGKDVSRPVLQGTEACPELTEDKIRQAVTVIPADYWQLNCWTCRDEGHSTFTCPYLTGSQRLYFAYRYYLHQIQANPRLAEFLEERLAGRLAEKPAVSLGNPTNRNTHGSDLNLQRGGHGREERGYRGNFGVRARGRGGLGRGGHRPTARQGVFATVPTDEVEDGDREQPGHWGDYNDETSEKVLG